MPVNISASQQGIFAITEATSGTYTAPTSAAFLQTVDLKPAFNQADKKTLKLDSLGRASTISLAAKKHHKLPFGCALSWPAGAPTATTNLLAFDPLFRACGSAAAVAVAAAGTVPAHIEYIEQPDVMAVSSVSISHRRTRSATLHYERQLAGSRGQVKFTWKASEVPKFEFEMYGKWQAVSSVAAMNGTPGIQLSNVGQPANSLNTQNVLLNSLPLCATEIVDDNLFRMKAAVIESLCGTGPVSSAIDSSHVTVTFKQPDISTEFNPDSYWGGVYPFEFTIKGDGGSAGRSLRFSWASVNVDSVDEVEVDGLVHIKMVLSKTSPLILQLF